MQFLNYAIELTEKEDNPKIHNMGFLFSLLNLEHTQKLSLRKQFEKDIKEIFTVAEDKAKVNALIELNDLSLLPQTESEIQDREQ